MKLNIIIIGRTNVGKSTLFNRLTKSKDAIVGDLEGLTRDIHYGYGKVGDRPYIIIDSGGFDEINKKNDISKLVYKQTIRAIDESDIILFIVDGRCGITNKDKEIANYLRKIPQNVYLIINKSESIDKNIISSEFYELGFKNFYAISSSHGDGVEFMINDILSKFPISEDEKDLNNDSIKFAIIGRPNVGKSTLVNAILGEDRLITFDKPGTTRDSINFNFYKDEKKYTIIDTAGLRKKSKIHDTFEKFSVIKTIKSIEQSNVIILVIDACEQISDQDVRISSIALSFGKPIIIAINKLDAINNKNDIKLNLRKKFYFLDYAEITYISALRKKNINSLFKLIQRAYNSSNIKMTTPNINKVLKIALEKQKPPIIHNKIKPKIKYAHQGGSNPPIIIIHGNSLNNISEDYTRYLIKTFRKSFNIIATPLKIEYLSSKNNPFKNNNNKINLKRVKLSNRIAKREKKKIIKNKILSIKQN